MKPFIACAVAVLLWAGVDALAQGGGPDKDRQSRIKRNAPKAEDIQKDGQASAGTAQKQAGKAAEAAKAPEAGTAAPKPKQGGPAGKDAPRPADAPEKGKALGKDGAKRAQAFLKQRQHEESKHMARQARLVRIRELAAQKGDTEMVARVDKLIEKEKQVYGRKLQRMQEQPRATQQPPADTQPGAASGAGPDLGKGPQRGPDAKREKGSRGPSKQNN